MPKKHPGTRSATLFWPQGSARRRDFHAMKNPFISVRSSYYIFYQRHEQRIIYATVSTFVSTIVPHSTSESLRRVKILRSEVPSTLQAPPRSHKAHLLNLQKMVQRSSCLPWSRRGSPRRRRGPARVASRRPYPAYATKYSPCQHSHCPDRPARRHDRAEPNGHCGRRGEETNLRVQACSSQIRCKHASVRWCRRPHMSGGTVTRNRTWTTWHCTVYKDVQIR